MTNHELKKKKSPAVKCEPVSYTVGGKTTIHQPQTPRRGVSELMMELNRSLEGSAQQPLVRELIACYSTERVDSYYEHAPLSTRPLSYPQPNRLSSYVKDLLARQFVSDRRGMEENVRSGAYAVVVIGGANILCRNYTDCQNHSHARQLACAEADMLEHKYPCEVMVVGPWKGDTKLAPADATVTVCWNVSLFEVEDPDGI